jgi:hypothetical protein
MVKTGIPSGGVVDQVDLTQAAKLYSQPGFQADATHLELAYCVHRILVAVGKGELANPAASIGKRCAGLSTRCFSRRSFSPRTFTRKLRRGQAAPTPLKA